MDLYNFIKGLKNGAYMVVCTETEPKMLKTNNIYLGRVKKVSAYAGVRTGVDYANCIASAMQRAGVEGNFTPDAPRGMVWDTFPKILKGIKDPNQLYFRISIDKSLYNKSYWTIDGRVATDVEVADIKKFLPAVSGSAKQAAAGLTDTADQIQVRSIKFENVLYIKQGKDNEYKNEERLAALEQAVEQMPALQR